MKWWPKRKRLDDESTNIGNMLILMELVNADQLRAAVSEKLRREDRKLGMILVEQGAITSEQLEEALELQGQMRSGKKTDAMISIVTNKTRRHHARLVEEPIA